MPRGLIICHVTSVHQATDIRIYHKECRSLARAGHDVTLLVPHNCDEAVDGISIVAVEEPVSRRQRMLRTATGATLSPDRITSKGLNAAIRAHDLSVVRAAQRHGSVHPAQPGGSFAWRGHHQIDFRTQRGRILGFVTYAHTANACPV